MKRWALVPVLAGLSVVATACPEPAPSGWKAPVVQSVVVSPSTVEAGTDFTVTATVTDDKQVVGVGFALYTGAVGQLGTPRWIDCEQDPFVAGPTVVAVLRCSMPDFAPNGNWNVAISAQDGEYTPPPPVGFSKVQAFAVTGGANDQQGPTISPLTLTPAPPVAGAPFTVTVDVTDERLRNDDTLIVAAPSSPTNPTTCPQASKTPVDATTTRYSFTCPALPAGTVTVTSIFFDQAGNSSSRQDVVTVAPA